MAQADSKVLVLGALAGVAGVSLAVVCYQSVMSRRRGSWPVLPLSRTSEHAADVTVVNGSSLSHGQAEVLERLETLIQVVSELKDEMKALKNALPTLQDQLREEFIGQRGAEGGTHRASPLHRTTPIRRKRAARAVAEARAGTHSSEEAESEAGYMTALTDSEEELRGIKEQPVDKLSALFERVDSLRQGAESDKRESLAILLEQKEEFGENSTFLWRLIRAYSDAHDISSTVEEKKRHAESGKKVGEEAVSLNPTCAESHKWYAIMCGVMAEYDTVHNKIKNGYLFKDHLDKAIELKPQDPLSYYLMGRWCYAVAQLSWLERRVAATLFGEPPSATVADALKNFLKVEELHPGYSKVNYVYLAKCYRALGQMNKARKMCEAACSTNSVSKEDEDAQKELDSLVPSLGV